MSRAVLEVPWDSTGVFLERPNRFIGIVDIHGVGRERVHVHDPGRLKELLYSGNSVLLRAAHGRNRSTNWDLVAADYNGQWVFVNSGYHSTVADNILTNPALSPWKDVRSLKREVRFGRSRLDFVVTHSDGRKTVVEVKGCTLAVDGRALFPDAPTSRGKRHLDELAELRRTGYGAALVVLVFREDAGCFTPNTDTDPAFAEAFARALEAGVEVHPILLGYSADRMAIEYVGRIPLCR